MPIALFPSPALFRSTAPSLFDAVSDGAVLFDGIDMPSLAAAGDLMQARGTRFAVGSSGVTRALVMAWQASGVIAPPAALERAAEVDRMLVVSGSCSPVTAAQIACGLADGYVGIRADVPALMRSEEHTSELQSLMRISYAVFCLKKKTTTISQ